MTPLEFALAYARRGWPVFPCNPRNKRPLPKGDVSPDGQEIPNTGGVKKATVNVDQVTAWWSQWPRAMVGLALGPGCGMFAVDIDAGQDEDTGEVFAATTLIANLERELGVTLPATWLTKTPRGGRHLFFCFPAGETLGNRAGLLGPTSRIDIRGAGGYVILPPSTRDDGKEYEWLCKPVAEDDWPAEAPAELVDCILRRARWARHKENSAR